MYFLKLNKNKVIKTITWCKCFVFSLLASSSQLAARQAQAARYTQREHSRWAAGRNAEVLGQGRARWLWGTQSCQAAANGQQCLLLGAFLCRFFCFDFYHNPQARWFGDARILNPTDTQQLHAVDVGQLCTHGKCWATTEHKDRSARSTYRSPPHTHTHPNC